MIEGTRQVREAGHRGARVALIVSEALRELHDAGDRVQPQPRSGRSYYEKIVTTHSYDDRLDTIRAAKELGLRTCVGGIFGMGEQPEHRAELAMELRGLDVDECRSTSSSASRAPTCNTSTRCRRTRCCASSPASACAAAAEHLHRRRPAHLGQLQPMILAAGASGMMIGDSDDAEPLDPGRPRTCSSSSACARVRHRRGPGAAAGDGPTRRAAGRRDPPARAGVEGRAAAPRRARAE